MNFVDQPADNSLDTRPSLLQRLGSNDDTESWQDFYRIYGGLIRHFATKAGLTADEAEEVVQETAIGVARGLPNFVYDPKVCRFKTWLLNLTHWRIQDQLRRQRPHQNQSVDPKTSDDRTATINRIPNPVAARFGSEWDSAWEKNMFAQALDRVKNRLDERQFQIFDLNVVKDRPAAEVAKTLNISIARVYLAKHRVSSALKKEIARMEKHL